MYCVFPKFRMCKSLDRYFKNHDAILCQQFIQLELEHDGGSEIFHGSDDFISVHELWQMWKNSPGK